MIIDKEIKTLKLSRGSRWLIICWIIPEILSEIVPKTTPNTKIKNR